MKCAYHPEADVVGSCVSCGRLICAECKTVLGEKIYCNPCADKLVASKVETGDLAMENTSGQGKLAVVPKEIRGWNWGAFLLTWIWGLCHNVWIALSALIPYIGVIMAFVLGAKGTEWAWQNKRWDSIDHFKRTQRTWAYWGAGLTVFTIAGYIILSILAYQ